MSKNNIANCPSQDGNEPSNKGIRVKPPTISADSELSHDGKADSHALDATVSANENILLSNDLHQRLQPAARILANGAIRATLKQRAQQKYQALEKTPTHKKLPKKVPLLYAPISDTSLPSNPDTPGA